MDTFSNSQKGKQESKDAQTGALGQKCRSVLLKSDVSVAMVIRVVLQIWSHDGLFGIVILMPKVFCILKAGRSQSLEEGVWWGGC